MHTFFQRENFLHRGIFYGENFSLGVDTKTQRHTHKHANRHSVKQARRERDKHTHSQHKVRHTSDIQTNKRETHKNKKIDTETCKQTLHRVG